MPLATGWTRLFCPNIMDRFQSRILVACETIINVAVSKNASQSSNYTPLPTRQSCRWWYMWWRYLDMNNNIFYIPMQPMECRHLASVVMGDNVKIIEWRAFCLCTDLRFIRLSKTLEHIGGNDCYSLEALFLPSTVKSIGPWAFKLCP